MEMKKVLLVAGATTGVSYLAYRGISEEMMKLIFSRKDSRQVRDTEYLDWLSHSKTVQVKVKSFDGLKLNAYNIANHDDNRYIIMVHSISSDKTSMYSRAYEFDKMGYNILLVDQRSAGDSEGERYTYGMKEAQDLQIWVNYLIKKYPDCRICLYGYSTGAAAVMMATGYQLPEQVKCLIEESGFSSLEEQIDHTVKRNYRLSFTYPVIRMIEGKMKERFGMSLEDCNAKKYLESNEIPILFVHGEKDEKVPFDMSKILYNHNKGAKKFYPIAEAGHGECVNDEKYFVNLDSFIRSYM